MDVSGLSYTQLELDRAPDLREQINWAAAQLLGDGALIIPVHQQRFALHEGDEPIGMQWPQDTRQWLIERAAHKVFLGLTQTQPQRSVFVLDLSSIDESEFCQVLKTQRLSSVRDLVHLVDRQMLSLLGYAQAMLHWHQANRYCGFCGGETVPRDGGHRLQCKQCKKNTFPRTDPAVIMLVEYHGGDQPMCLLGRSKRLPQGVYSALAGFVDPCETLEQAVAREVEEEAGIIVDHVEYMASQPWPFPASLMIAYRATTSDPTIDISRNELEDAQWFTVEQIRAMESWQREDWQPGQALRLPRKDSVASYLVSQWLT